MLYLLHFMKYLPLCMYVCKYNFSRLGHWAAYTILGHSRLGLLSEREREPWCALPRQPHDAAQNCRKNLTGPILSYLTEPCNSIKTTWQICSMVFLFSRTYPHRLESKNTLKSIFDNIPDMPLMFYFMKIAKFCLIWFSLKTSQTQYNYRPSVEHALDAFSGRLREDKLL